MNAPTARGVCLDLGADFPIIRSEEEKNFLNHLLPQHWAFWLGGSARFSESTPYYWYDGSEISSDFLHPNMPYDLNDPSLSTCYDPELDEELCIRWVGSYWQYVSCRNEACGRVNTAVCVKDEASKNTYSENIF